MKVNIGAAALLVTMMAAQPAEAQQSVTFTCTSRNINGSAGDAIQREQMAARDGADNNGGAGGATLSGGGGNDHISGGSGKDIIIGGAGQDVLAGGPGADVFRFGFVSQYTVDPIADSGSYFVYRDAAYSPGGKGPVYSDVGSIRLPEMDVILDFQVGIDKLDLSPLTTHSTADLFAPARTLGVRGVFIGDADFDFSVNRLQVRSEIRDGSTYVEFFAPGVLGVSFGGAIGAIRLLGEKALAASDLILDAVW